MTSKKKKKNQEKILFLLMGVIIVGLAVAGYFLFQKQLYSLLKPSTTTKSQTIATPIVDYSNNTAKETTREKEEEYIPQEEVQYLQVYYGIKGKDKLECENKRFRKNPMLIGQARQIVNSLIEVPTNERLYRILPENLSLRGLFYDSGLFTIDFSREFNKIYNYGANEQILAVYSIVNSLTELDPNAQVKFLINGTEPENDNGHVDLSMKLSRLESIIEK